MTAGRAITWTEAEWSSILFYAQIARRPRPLPVHGLTARGAQAYASRHLRALATNSEVLLAWRARS